jgi:hypothetical protein
MSIRGKTDLSSADMLQMMGKNQNFDFLIVNIRKFRHPLNEETILNFKEEVDSYIKVKKESTKPLLAIVPEMTLGRDDYDNSCWNLLCEARTKFIAANIPWYPGIGRAAIAVGKLIDYYQKKNCTSRH